VSDLLKECERTLADIAESGHRGDAHPKGAWVPKAENGSQMVQYFANGWSKCMDEAEATLAKLQGKNNE